MPASMVKGGYFIFWNNCLLHRMSLTNAFIPLLLFLWVWMPSRVQRELAEVVCKPLYHLWKVMENKRGAWRLEESQCYPSLQKGQGGHAKLQARQHHFCPWKVRKQLILNFTSKKMEERKVIRNSQQGFSKGKSCLINLVAFVMTS